MNARSKTLRTIRDACVVAAVAVLTVQGLRRYLGDRYLVPSDSMLSAHEPAPSRTTARTPRFFAVS